MMPNTTSASNIRSTQRPPQSCKTCAKRRVRCDKNIPCQQCLSRGQELTCERETVRVKGALVASQPTPSYQDLLSENRRLKSELEHSRLRSGSLSSSDDRYAEVLNVSENFERQLFGALGNTTRSSTVTSDAQICWPTKECVQALLVYGKTWTSWIHCALHHPSFENECHIFLNVPGDKDSFWLAVYFSFLSATLLFMDENEAKIAGITQEPQMLILNWYDSALYFLHKADFLRRPNIRTIQAIAILGIVFINVGDWKMYGILWACAIRIAQSLHMGDDRAHENETLLETELRRRLWWTLILCEWIPIPYHPPCISEADFHVELPSALDDDELLSSARSDRLPRPIEYHIVMIQLARIYHHFRTSLRSLSGSMTDIVILVAKTDEALANTVGDLPAHLQGNMPDNAPSHNDVEAPWISWQRTNISLVLLYYRIAVNRVLQNQWVQDPTTFVRARAICVGSARGIISLASACTNSLARNRPWATSLHMFSAAIILAVEARFHADESREQYIEDIEFCITFLDGVKDQSIIATHAAQILLEQFPTERRV